MKNRPHWNLGGKIALVAAPFLALALISITTTLWVSWQLDGGAAAVNEAGRMRMQAYRLALSVGTGAHDALPGQVLAFERSLALLRSGDPERPLFMPWDDTAHGQFEVVESGWKSFRQRWTSTHPEPVVGLVASATGFVAEIDELVAGIETHMSRWTALLHLLQMAMMALAVLGAAVLLYTGYLLVRPEVGRIHGGGRPADAAIGFVSGVMGGMTGFSGPIVTLWCALRPWGKYEQRQAYQPYLLVMHLATIVSLAMAGTLTQRTGELFLIGTPIVVAGLWAGFRLYRRIDDQAYRRVVLWLLLASGFSLLW